mmetsp:Transcript_33876/g.24920  ORF Transcript_33876/g.24920 Transcript_33876/m.24920 type:complete len:245 (+) Transcript_33876:1704-2438(+)
MSEDNQVVINQLAEFEDFHSESGLIHNGIRFKDPRYLFLTDNAHFYKLDIETSSSETIRDQFVKGLYFSDNNYLYTLSKDGPNHEGGLRLYDITNVIEKGKDISYLLSNKVNVGIQASIDFSAQNQRMIFQSSFKAIEVLPILHRNTVSFIGMRPRSEYLAYKIEKDKLIALSNANVLSTWDVLTGVLLGSVKEIDEDYSGYDIYQGSKDDQTYLKNWFPWYLLIKKVPEPENDISMFFAGMRQ